MHSPRWPAGCAVATSLLHFTDRQPLHWIHSCSFVLQFLECTINKISFCWFSTDSKKWMINVGLRSSSGNVLAGVCFSWARCLQSGVPITKTVNTTTTTTSITAAAAPVNLSACNSLRFYSTFPFCSEKEKREKVEKRMKIIEKTALFLLCFLRPRQCLGFFRVKPFAFGRPVNNSCGVPVPKGLIIVWLEIKILSRRIYLSE